ncbi:hypothetical protein M8C21_002572, partial [Ambrosia artemisiifolia]
KSITGVYQCNHRCFKHNNFRLPNICQQIQSTAKICNSWTKQADPSSCQDENETGTN